VLVLTDKHLATSFFAAEPFATEGLRVDRGLLLAEGEVPPDFKRYETTPSGVSTRTVPGLPGGIFNANSDEHDELGYFSEDAPMVATQVDKRCRKYFTAATLVHGIKFHGNPGADTVLVGWARRKERSSTRWTFYERMTALIWDSSSRIYESLPLATGERAP